MSEPILQASDSQNYESGFPGDDTPVTVREKAELFFQAHWGGLVCLLAPIILIAILIPFPPEKYQWCAYTLILMAIYWVTECIPLPITSFLPVLIFPLTGVMNTSETCNCYINDTIVMFLGSLILAYAVEQSGLHKRLALCAIRVIGYSHYRLLFAMSFTTMFVSMWITNTAATTMMVPINFAILQVFEEQNLLSIYETDVNGNTVASDIATCYFCSASFSATIGGIGTIVGTATNLVFKGLFIRAYPEAPEYLSFPSFSAFAIPYMLAMEGCLYLSMLIMYFGFLRPKSRAAKSSTISIEGKEAAKAAVDENWKNLGKITFWEIMVIILFSGAMLMFFCRSPQIFTGWGDQIESHFGLMNKFARDSAAAMLVGFLMFLLPSTLDFFKNFSDKEDQELPNKPVRSVLDWPIMNEVMPYSFMFLLGIFDKFVPRVNKFYCNKGNRGKNSDTQIKLYRICKKYIALQDTKIQDTRSCSKYNIIYFGCYVILAMLYGNLVGGGFALSEAAKKEHSNLNGKIGEILKTLSSLPNYFIILLIIVFTVFITNFASNVAVCNVITPIVMQMANEINTNPLWYNIAAGFSASYCFCLPVGTPGNLIIQGAASIPTGKMIKAGIFPTISCVLLTWLCICFWAPVIWPDLHILPVWTTS